MNSIREANWIYIYCTLANPSHFSNSESDRQRSLILTMALQVTLADLRLAPVFGFAKGDVYSKMSTELWRMESLTILVKERIFPLDSSPLDSSTITKRQSPPFTRAYSELVVC